MSESKPDVAYRMLEKDEIINRGDEVDCAVNWNDSPDWRVATNCIGEPAPDPQYIGHRRYRRPIEKSQ